MKFKKKIKRLAAITSAVTVITGTLSGLNLTGFITNMSKTVKAYTFYYRTDSFSQTINGVTWNVTCSLSTDGSTRLDSVKVENPEKITGDIRIPDTFQNGYEVKLTKLSDSIFKGSQITSVVLNDYITEINKYAFQNCKNLKSVTLKNVTEIGCYAFNGCENLEEVKGTVSSVDEKAFRETKIKTISISGNEDVNIGGYAFYHCPLEKFLINDTVPSITIYPRALLGTKIQELTFPCNVAAYAGAFSNMLYLRKVEFHGIYTEKKYPFTVPDVGTFENSFSEEYDNGKLIKKEVIFHSDTTLYTNVSDSINYGSFKNCTGLRKITFKETASIDNECFYGCENLNEIQFSSKDVTLGNNLFLKCQNLHKLEFYGDVLQNAYDSANNSILGNNSPVKEVYFYGNEGTNVSVNFTDYNSKLEKLYYGVENIYGTLKNSSSLKNVIFAYPTPFINIHDNLTHIHDVYGYTSVNASKRSVEKWIIKSASNYATFNNIISNIYDIEPITYIDTVNKTDIDFNNINVTVEYAYDLNHTHTITASTSGNDLDGFKVDTSAIPDTLVPGTYLYSIIYSNKSVNTKIIVEAKKVTKLNVDWNTDKIHDLVSNQPITVTDIISGAIVTYNNGTVEYVTADQLSLNKTTTTAGDNTFIVTLNGTNIKAEKTFLIKENYITSIKAEYNSNSTVYVGDKIDASKIKLTPTYKYNDDKTSNRNITSTKISDIELKEIGTNEITVYYNDLKTTMIVFADAVVPTKLYATFDTNCKYYEGQDIIDPKTIAVTIEYNNGSKKSGSDIKYAYDVKEIVKTTNTVQAIVSYQGLETTVDIPITPKEITDIKASSNIASATEGTTLTKTIIDKIALTYNNGKTETLDATTIDYDSLTFNDYVIVANEKNTITVNYAGKSTQITIVGVPNTITNIYAEYIGTGQTVGTQVPVSDVSVHAVNSNGQIMNITDGILLKNAVPYNVGLNTVTVHYGSFSCTITVTGLPVTAATSEPSVSPDATEKTNTTDPSKTEQPDVITTPTGTETPNSTTVVAAPDTANNAPNTANTSITVKSNNKNIKTTTDKIYKVYTNQTVTFTINGVSGSAIKYQVVAKGAKISDTAWKDVANNNITISRTTKPSIVYIQYTDANGEIQTIHTNGFTIDKKKAMVNIKQGKTYKKGQKVTFKDASGIKSAKLDGKKIKSGIKVKKIGTHTLVVTDKARNKTTIKFKIK